MVFTVGVIGGGIAGSTIAMRLSEMKIQSIVFEKGALLVNGPPMCHLHAGGALYRQIPIQECKKLLKQSINTLKHYKHCANLRPTLLMVPTRDPGEPSTIVERMKILRNEYQKLVNQNPSNEVLGKPQYYFRVFEKQEILKLRQKQLPNNPSTVEEWIIPPAKYLDLNKFKFPFVAVQEYGLSSMRISAFANMALQNNQSCKILLSTCVTKVEKTIGNRWKITYTTKDFNEQFIEEVDYLVNAGGYQSGTIDQMCGFVRPKILQFKSAYVCRWNLCLGVWPEVIIHGKRKSPQGMAQLTPYANNYFQIHGMTQDITLFKNGSIKSDDCENMPSFQRQIQDILTKGWNHSMILERTQKAIQYVSYFIPSFRSATQVESPLWGVQQIPGNNPDLRASEISYEGDNYARAEIVKASTAIEDAECLLKQLQNKHKIQLGTPMGDDYDWIQPEKLEQKAKEISEIRNFPKELALFYN